MVGLDAADDLAQQAFIKAWQALNRFDGRATFGTWLYRIAMNLCYDELRHQRRFRPLPLADVELLPDAQDLAATVEASDELEGRRAALAWALNQLPSADRLLLSLRLADGRSYDQIGDLLEISPVTVGTRLFRARARLQRLIRERLRMDDGLR